MSGTAADSGGARADSGSATVWVLALAIGLASAGVVVALVLGVTLAHRRAVAAADLAALAAAGRLDDAPWRACQAATTVAVANGARVRSCQVEGDSVVVSVVVEQVPPLVPAVRASARAGVPALPGALHGQP